MSIKDIIKISRPRFWLYEAATFGLIGTLGAMNGFSFFSDWKYWLFAFYFLIPANILIYGINDIFDYETDKFNPRKGTYEAIVPPENQKKLWKWILITNIPFFFFVPLEWPLILSFFAFVFFASFYSAKPIRAKARVFMDSIFSAGHYVATGVFGYYLAQGTEFPTIGVVAGMTWAIAMHAYSAVPDIKADLQSGLRTIAIMIGRQRTIMFCWFLYILSTYLVRNIIPLASIVSGIVFSYFMWKSLKTQNDEDLLKIYKYFPTINAGIGAIVSISLFAKNF